MIERSVVIALRIVLFHYDRLITLEDMIPEANYANLPNIRHIFAHVFFVPYFGCFEMYNNFMYIAIEARCLSFNPWYFYISISRRNQKIWTHEWEHDFILRSSKVRASVS